MLGLDRIDNDVRNMLYIATIAPVACAIIAWDFRRWLRERNRRNMRITKELHETLTPAMALRLQNDGFGPCTCLYEATTLEEMLGEYSVACLEAQVAGQRMTVDGYLKQQLDIEIYDREGQGLPKSDIGRAALGIAMRCSVIMQTPAYPLVRNPEEAMKCKGIADAPNDCYLTDEEGGD